MRKILYSLAFAAVLLVSCEEWEPIFTKYGDDPTFKPVEMTPNITIAELKALYQKEGDPVKIDEELIIGGQVVSEDRSGNIYKELYIQDASGAISIKMGQYSMYNDYKPGQWVYVKCSGLTLGSYSGMLQLGFMDPSGDYETAYLEEKNIIATHVFKGKLDTPVQPLEMKEADLVEALKEGSLKSDKFGRLVTLKGLKYNGKIFCLVYIDYDKDTKLASNRIFLSDQTYGVTTWAMTKNGFLAYLNAGNFDKATSSAPYYPDRASTSVADLKDVLVKNASAYSVSQYFIVGKTDVQIRTSGYARFADSQMDPRILTGEVTIDVTGILAIYNGDIQFTLIYENSISINE